MQQQRRLITTPWLCWLAAGIALVTAAQPLNEMLGDLESTGQAEKLARQLDEKNEADWEQQERDKQEKSRLALSRIQGTCAILENPETGELTYSLNHNYKLQSPDGVPLPEGTAVCTRSGVTGKVAHFGSIEALAADVVELAAVTRDDYPLYERMYNTYPEVAEHESQDASRMGQGAGMETDPNATPEWDANPNANPAAEEKETNQ